jgi:hypothetical protein
LIVEKSLVSIVVTVGSGYKVGGDIYSTSTNAGDTVGLLCLEEKIAGLDSFQIWDIGL